MCCLIDDVNLNSITSYRISELALGKEGSSNKQEMNSNVYYFIDHCSDHQ